MMNGMVEGEVTCGETHSGVHVFAGGGGGGFVVVVGVDDGAEVLPNVTVSLAAEVLMTNWTGSSLGKKMSVGEIRADFLVELLLVVVVEEPPEEPPEPLSGGGGGGIPVRGDGEPGGIKGTIVVSC